MGVIKEKTNNERLKYSSFLKTNTCNLQLKDVQEFMKAAYLVAQHDLRNQIDV